MPVSPSRLGRGLLRTLPAFTHQTAVSVAAAFCVAAVTGSLWPSQEAPQRAATVALDAAAVVGLLNTVFTADGVRNQPRYPMEFETVLGPASAASFARFASADWPQSIAAPATRIAAAELPARPGPDRIRMASLEKPRAARPPLPPVRLADRTETRPSAVAATPEGVAREERRATILGLSLPGFVPSGRQVVETVASVAGSMTGAVVDHLPRI